MSLAIDINIGSDLWLEVDDLDGLVRRATAAATAVSETTIANGAELSILLCDDAFMRELNKTWRGKDVPTNVLSFPATEPHDAAAAGRMLGDIIIAFETSAREAAETGRPLADHLSFLLIHGFLHLLGFDHEDDEDAEAMERLETQAVNTLGLASPHHDAEPVNVQP